MDPVGIVLIIVVIFIALMFFGTGPCSNYNDIEPPTISNIRENNPNFTEEEIQWVIEYEEENWGGKLKP